MLQHSIAWLGATPFALWLGQSTIRIAWLFTFHVFGLILLLGGTIFLSLRMLSLVQKAMPVPAVARAVLPVTTVGLLLMLASGFTIFTGGAVAYSEGTPFRIKMSLLLVAVLFHFAVFRRVAKAPEGKVSQAVYSGTGVAALVIWFAVAWAGRLIAFF